MPRKRRNNSEPGVEDAKKVRKEKDDLKEGDPVLCPFEFGVWWPGFISKRDQDKLTIGFFDETETKSLPISKVVPYMTGEARTLIIASTNKLKKKKMTLLKKFQDDVKKARKLISFPTANQQPEPANNQDGAVINLKDQNPTESDLDQDLIPGCQEMPSEPEGMPTESEGMPTEPEGMPTEPEGMPSKPEGMPSKPEGMPSKPEEMPSKPEEMPTEPEEMPTEAEEMPTEAEGMPTEAEGMPTEADGMPTEAEGMPTESEGMPTESEGMPTESEGMPTEPEGMPTEPEGMPSKPEEMPSKPEGMPTEPEEMPSKPEEMPSKPEGMPTEPEEMPSKPEEMPTEPEGMPTEAEEMPSEPEGMPTEPEGMPTEPEGMPSESEGMDDSDVDPDFIPETDVDTSDVVAVMEEDFLEECSFEPTFERGKKCSTSEPVCSTSSTSEPVCSTSSTSEPEPVCSTISTSEPVCSTSEPVCSTSSTSEPVCSTSSTSEPVCSTNLPCESFVKEQERLPDITNSHIFIKKLSKKANNESKHGRTYDRRHACKYCGKLMTNIQSHLEHAHRNCEEVRNIFDLKRKLETVSGAEKDPLAFKIHQVQTLLRNQGNHNHNMKVCQQKKGEIILTRRRDTKTFDVAQYGPCPRCMEWIQFDGLAKHKNSCILNKSSEKDDFTKGTSIIQAKILKGQILTKPSKRLLKEVFPSMMRDEVTDVAQGDQLIVSLGEIWLMKNIGNKLRRKNFTSFRMRLAARLLMLLRKGSGNSTASMNDFLVPTYFDLVVECCLKACRETEDSELQNPSTALKLGYDLSRLASAKLGFSIKKHDEIKKTESTDFLKLVQMEWSVKVSKIARVILSERHFNKGKSLPNPDDIANLAFFLVKELKDLNLSEPSPQLFREAVILCQSRLLLYNRRRPGELESLSVDTYIARPSIDETELSLRQNLSQFERKLLSSQDLIEIRGKTGRCVPLLIPHEAKRILEFLSNSSIREKAGIKKDNSFVFANTGETVVRAGDSLNEIKTRLKLKQPSRILATNLRKHTATISQVVSLDEQQMKNLCNHLGHTQRVHDEYYRQTSGLIERIDIAKLMLMQEHNMVGKYANKKLSEIQFDDILEDIDDSTCNQEESRDVQEANEEFEDTLDEPKSKKKKDSKRIRWSRGEMDEIAIYFEKYFQEGSTLTCPSKEDCKSAALKSEQNKGNIWKRGWETIKKKVNNMLKK